jgi:3-hydroxybutyrate dehydrogenase
MTNSQHFLHNRVAAVTGGATGIGRAIALALAQAGATVAIGSRSAKISSIQADIEAIGGKALVLTLDVASADSVQAFCKQVTATLDTIDILVNAAGIVLEHSIEAHPDELWQQMIQINLNGTYQTIKYCLPGMKAQKWGRIINIASTAATVGAPGFAAYSASKAGVVGLSRCVALEGADFGITCNALSPGWVETDMALDWVKAQAIKEGRAWKDYLEEMKQQINPQKRLIQPQEIAALTVFLCREDARAITMQDITVSAGGLW